MLSFLAELSQSPVRPFASVHQGKCTAAHGLGSEQGPETRTWVAISTWHSGSSENAEAM